MSDWPLRTLALALVVVSIASCSRDETVSADIKPRGRVEDPSVVVTIVDRAEYDAALVSLRGKVVLVDCWATWCLPCLEQLPHSLELAKRHADLAVVTLNFDDPSKSEQVSKVLAAKGGGTSQTHFLSREGGGTQSMEDFAITGGALPHYKLYDRSGKLRRSFELDPAAEKQFTTADIETAVSEILREAN